MEEKIFVADGHAHILIWDPADSENLIRVYKSKSREGEEALMLAVLADAVDCFQKYVLAVGPREQKLFRDAEAWILEPNGEWIFSFQNICEALELNPDYVRHGLLQWKQKQIDRFIRARQVPKRRYGRNVAHLTT
jgi:hypothetical protein